ncbi:hypothetical protein ACHAXR_008446 [Thalassiosira sp. AJA248-18]
MLANHNNIQRPYKCTVHIALPSKQYAQYLKDVVSVDQEISNKVVKSFALVKAPADGSQIDNEKKNYVFSQFEATEAKMLRVSISTTYDMINVALKCFQEFGE